MTPVDRDLQVVQFVAQFEAVTSAHIGGVLFAANASPTPVKRVLTRLVAQKYLARYRWRHLPSNRAGSGEYVYQLGPNGWRYIGYEGAYKRLEAFDRHKLAIADLYVALKGLEQLGLIEVLETVTEPNSWRRIGHIDIRPDLFCRVRSRADDSVTRIFYEVDLGSEHERQIKAKVSRFRQAWERADATDAEWNPFPRVLFVVQTSAGLEADKRRKQQLVRWVGNGELVSVCTFAELAQALIA